MEQRLNLTCPQGTKPIGCHSDVYSHIYCRCVVLTRFDPTSSLLIWFTFAASIVFMVCLVSCSGVSSRVSPQLSATVTNDDGGCCRDDDPHKTPLEEDELPSYTDLMKNQAVDGGSKEPSSGTSVVGDLSV